MRGKEVKDRQEKTDVLYNGILASIAVGAAACIGYTALQHGVEKDRLEQMSQRDQADAAARGVDAWPQFDLLQKATLFGPYLADLQHDTRSDAQRTLAQNEAE